MPPHGGSDSATAEPPLSTNTAASSALKSSSAQWEQCDKMILDYYEKVRLTNEEYLEAVAFTQKMEEEIRKTMPEARLEIGGSLCNGFGTHDSDVDLCFRLKEDIKPKAFNELKTLTELSEILTEMGLKNKLIHAKVRIIKCDDNNSMGRPIDISCYNSLPLYNTKLLAKYCEWEPKRLPALGVWVKKWAKSCCIGDASEGTLSSYAWMIMLIHYLQNCYHPVLPRLQEDFRDALTPPAVHMKCDVYFHEEVQENWSKNTSSVAELFCGFLTYLLHFDYEHVIFQIRRRKELKKREKGWFGQMCVEDPFLLSHNMAQRRGRQVIEYILDTVVNSQKAFFTAETFDAEEIMKNCRLDSDPNLDKRCELCSCRTMCEDECENRYLRHPHWISREERAKDRKAKKEFKKQLQQKEKEKRPPRKQVIQEIVPKQVIKANNNNNNNNVTDLFAELRIAQQNLAPYLTPDSRSWNMMPPPPPPCYTVPPALLSPPPQGYSVPTVHIPPPQPLLGMYTVPPHFMYSPPPAPYSDFTPLMQEAPAVPQPKKVNRKPPRAKNAPPPGQRTFYNSNLYRQYQTGTQNARQTIVNQRPPDFSNEYDFPSL